MRPLQLEQTDAIGKISLSVERASPEQTALRQRTVLRELREMRRSLPLDFGSSCFLRFRASEPSAMRFCITGPFDTPYDSGCFFFDMVCPAAYPSVSPQVSLLTTGGGTVRFNPNLYKCGKVCLSLLGTWAGPGWVPGESNLYQVIVSIQGQILGVSKPVYNEPGVEIAASTRDDLMERTSANGGWEGLRIATIQWAMIDVLRNPPQGFERAVREYFTLKQDYIRQLVAGWIRHSSWYPGNQANVYRLQDLQQQLEGLLASLPPCPVRGAAYPPSPGEPPCGSEVSSALGAAEPV
jgi:baculoviral IAP repeat-containing protein 6